MITIEKVQEVCKELDITFPIKENDITNEQYREYAIDNLIGNGIINL